MFELGHDGLVRYELFTDYGQFELNDVHLHEVRDGSPLPGLIVDSSTFEYGIALVVFREGGTIAVDVDIFEAEPTPLGSEWQDVMECSVTAGESAWIAGWGNHGGGEIGLVEGLSYRIRYAVSGADESDGVSDPPHPELYRVDVWRAPLAAARVMVAASAAGTYWNAQHEARAAATEVASLPEGERFRALAELAFRDHPEWREKIRAGQRQWVSGVVAYTQKYFPRELPPPDAFAVPELIESIAWEG